MVIELDLPSHVQALSFASASQLADYQARKVAEALREAVDIRGRAYLVVPGGRSPVAFFQALAGQALPWEKVMIGLTDERWITPDRDGSNEYLVRRHLLSEQAAAATLIGLYRPAADIERAAAEADRQLRELPPIDVLVLGMGEDGHTASLFPDSPNLAVALAEDCPQWVMPMCAPQPPHERLTLTFPVLCRARSVWLAIQGPAKLDSLSRALVCQDEQRMPICALFDRPLTILWAP